MPDERPRPRRPGVPLRTAAVWATVSELAGRRSRELGRPLQVLDLGGGSGGLAVPLAELGHDVTVVDPSPDALASLRRRADETDAGHRVAAVQGDGDSLAEALGAGHGSVDLVTCHGTLELVDDPAATLGHLRAALAPGGHLSIVSAQRLAAVLSRALAGRFAEAHTALASADGRWGEADPAPRRFDRAALLDLVTGAGLTVEQVHGVRLFSDLVPSAYTESEHDRQALLALEEAAGAHPALDEIATAVHVLAAARG